MSEKPVVERVRFEMIVQRKHGEDGRGGGEAAVWTDGNLVRWRTLGGIYGEMPIELFRLAAVNFAMACEQAAISEDPDEEHTFYNAVHKSGMVPIELAAAHPFWRDPDDPRNDISSYFAGAAYAWNLDTQPIALKLRVVFEPDAKERNS